MSAGTTHVGSGKSFWGTMKKVFALSNLAAGGIATVVSALLDGGFSLDNVGQKALLFGAPTAVGCAVGSLVDTTFMKLAHGEPQSVAGEAITGLAAGATAAGILLLAGQLTRAELFAQEGLTTIAVAGGSCIAGELIAHAVGTA